MISIPQDNEPLPVTISVARRLTLRKAEKLRHKSLVDTLFREGNSTYVYPLRLVWRVMTTEMLESSFRNGVPPRIGPLQMLITIPKKKRRRAVDRVLMRRRIREAYRLGREPLRVWLSAHPECRSLQMGFIYLADKNLDYKTISRKMELLIQKMLTSASQQAIVSVSQLPAEPQRNSDANSVQPL
ncbi:MAG: ribonuclease P protein component [Muribaculaceae bacterium]|nr:ribonuclease P protein component [Muribaculaceae bacterium]